MNGVMRGVVRRLRQAALGSGGGMADGDLLERYLADGDEAAFAALVRRHGPMVLGVCRRILGNLHDADDAFQATFLVLVRKAKSIVPREQVGPWLYGVAYRTSTKAKAMNARRRIKQKPLEDIAAPKENVGDWSALLDQEVPAVPDHVVAKSESLKAVLVQEVSAIAVAVEVGSGNHLEVRLFEFLARLEGPL